MKFKTGDRVRIYGNSFMGASVSNCTAIINNQDNASGDGIWWVVQTSDGRVVTVHEKQCRRLKPKRKPREWWVVSDGKCSVHMMLANEKWPGPGWIKVREVLEKKEKK